MSNEGISFFNYIKDFTDTAVTINGDTLLFNKYQLTYCSTLFHNEILVWGKAVKKKEIIIEGKCYDDLVVNPPDFGFPFEIKMLNDLLDFSLFEVFGHGIVYTMKIALLATYIEYKFMEKLVQRIKFMMYSFVTYLEGSAYNVEEAKLVVYLLSKLIKTETIGLYAVSFIASMIRYCPEKKVREELEEYMRCSHQVLDLYEMTENLGSRLERYNDTGQLMHVKCIGNMKILLLAIGEPEKLTLVHGGFNFEIFRGKSYGSDHPTYLITVKRTGTDSSFLREIFAIDYGYDAYKKQSTKVMSNAIVINGTQSKKVGTIRNVEKQLSHSDTGDISTQTIRFHALTEKMLFGFVFPCEPSEEDMKKYIKCHPVYHLLDKDDKESFINSNFHLEGNVKKRKHDD